MDTLPLRLFFKKNYPIFLLALLVFAGLYVVAQADYLFFHSLAELFAILIAFTTFLITWNARRYLDNGYLLFVGISFLFVGGFDVLHTLSYKGMGVFPGEASNIPTQLWLCERFAMALSLFLAPFFLNRKPTRGFIAAVFIGFSLVSLFLLASIYLWKIMPVAYSDTAGLTPFKIYSEYFIIVLFLAGAIFLYLTRRAFDRDVLALMITSIAFNMVAEFIFTTYHAVDDPSNLFGHFIKITAYYLIYKAIIETGLVRPYNLLFRELSEREQALRGSQALEKARISQIEAIIDAVPAIVRIAHDPQGRKVTGNRMAYEFLRAQPGTNLSPLSEEGRKMLHYHAFQNGRELPPEEYPLQTSALNGQPLRDYEETITFEDGSSYRLLGNANPLYDMEGKPSGAVAVLMDITERTRTEQALAESERRYRRMFETMVEGLIIMETVCAPAAGESGGEDSGSEGRRAIVDLRLVEINPAFEHITGLARDQALGRKLSELMPQDYPRWVEHFARVVETGESALFEDYAYRFGKTFEIAAFQPAPDHCAALLTDVTERARAQEELRLSEARLRRLVDSNIIGIIFAMETGAVRVANDAFLDMLGYTRAEFEAGLINWVHLTPSEYLSSDVQGMAEARERGACTPYEKEYIRKDGARVPILIGYAYYDEGTPTFICFILDLTERKQAEARLEQYALQLERSNRELQDFAFVASHDLQEPLRKIQAFGERLQDHLGERLDPDEADYLGRMLSASSRMRAMINDLLALSRVTTRAQPFTQVDLNEVTREVLSDLEVRLAGSGGAVEVGKLPVIEADELQIHQLLQNLIGNALKFHKENVPPHVSVTEEYTDQPNRVTIKVQDNGIGFEQEYAERIFQPFQRLHGIGRYEGSGIGLAICRKIVERHSGSIEVTSVPGEGSTFIVTLPIKQTRKTG